MRVLLKSLYSKSKTQIIPYDLVWYFSLQIHEHLQHLIVRGPRKHDFT